ncbi:Tm-1-like ATP-binding domain-containing protein [Aspergillus undulatus]|uniref:Tm-1-like ATP-binding domain-containing protein n=1 Tax=Aspergillus undulatus TaxID=1810928 RepID=UPI003CCDCC12
MTHILLLGTLDTKCAETIYLYTQLQQTAARFSTPLKITLVDVGCRETDHDAITISSHQLISEYTLSDPWDTPSTAWELPRGQAIELLTGCASRCIDSLLHSEEVHGIVGTGGSGGTSLISAAMRTAAPIGLPKLIVSTVASGNTGPVVGECDITLMYSVVDIAGSNRLLKDVLRNAAGAIFGMATAYQQRLLERSNDDNPNEKKTRVGITMFGVTTPCVDRVRQHLESNYPVEVYVFHATGHGGKAMERYVSEGHLDAVLDITTTEICDLIAGGNMACDESRLETTLKRGIPNIISVGATDMVNFGPMDSVPPRYREGGRNLVPHNPSVTLMRTSKDECEQVGKFIVDKVNRFTQDPAKVEVWIPAGGVSGISTKGSVFADAEADSALFETLQSGLAGNGGQVRVVEDERAINEGGFAVDIANRLMELVAQQSGHK